MSRRRGLTLIELMVYMALVTMGLLMVGNVELAAQRSASLQQALLDLELRAHDFSRDLRSDIEAAGHIRYIREQDTLEIRRHDGRWIYYRPGRRAERADHDGPDLRLDLYGGRIRGWTLEQTRVRTPLGGQATRYQFTLQVAVPDKDGGAIERVRRVSAVPRREVPGA